MLINTQRLTSYLKENVMLTVYFSPVAPEGRVDQVVEKIEAMDFVKESEFVSKEQAAESFREELQTDFRETLGENPLPSSLDIYVRSEYTDTSSISEIRSEILNLDFVQDVDYQADLISDINRNQMRLGYILGAIALIMILISIILINNTVRLGVYANRFLIKSMQLVGATEWFIVRPFLSRAFWTGIAGTILSGLLLGLSFLGLARWIDKEIGLSAHSETSGWFQKDVLTTYSRYVYHDISEYSILFVSLLVLGIAILVLSTYLSTKKYLKLKIDDLY